MMKLRCVCLIILSMTQQVTCVSIGEEWSEQFGDYVNIMKIELERKYEARFQALESKFSSDLEVLKLEFAVKETEYISRIETLESTVDQIKDCLEDELDTSPIKERETQPNIITRNEETQNETKLSNVGRGIFVKNQLKKRQVFVQTENRIAFFASLTNYVNHMGANQDIVFDKVVTNLGSAYNDHHGIFVAPVTGTYVFFTTLHTYGAITWGHFMVNGVIVAKIHLDGAQNSQTVVVHLNKGEDVSIQNTEVDRSVFGDRYSTFGGFLLYVDAQVETIG